MDLLLQLFAVRSGFPFASARNPEVAATRAEFLLEGKPGPTRAWMEWEAGGPLD